MKWSICLEAVLICISFVNIFAQEKTKTKTVTTSLSAKWNSTPFALEISEFLNDENPSAFWSFIDDVSKLADSWAGKSDKEQYEELLESTKKYLSDTQISLLRFSLSLHIYSPKIEMFHQIALIHGIPSSCEAAADIGGVLTCNPEEVQSLLKPNLKKPDIYKLDHQYPTKSTMDQPVVILYGQLGSKKFARFHSQLKSLAEAEEIVYYLRHYVNVRKGPKVRLSGYGVELQIKSTEYKAQDDTKVKADLSTTPGEETSQVDEEEDVEGFLFSKLKTLHPELSSGLEKLRQQLLEEAHELGPLKVWQLQELSLQAAERVLNSARDESLKILTQLSQNFPLLARSLVKTTVRPALKEEIKRNQQYFINDLNIQPSEAALFINGQYFSIDVVDIFSLFDQIREEVKVVEGLYKVGVPFKHINSLLSLDLSPPTLQYAIDIRDSAVVYINDIEKDQQYKRWSSTLHELLRPSYPGMLRTIRRNMYHLVLVVDPTKKESRSIVKLAESFYVHNAPLRIGIVLAVNPDSALTGRNDVGVAILNGFNYVSQQSNAYRALSFITDLFALVGDDEISVKDVEKLLKTKFSADIEEVLGEDSDYDVGRQLTKDFLRRTGLRRLPQAFLNGVMLDEKMLNSDDFEEAVLTEIMRQTTILQKALFKGELKDEDEVLDFLMTQPNVMPRLNDRVLSSSAKYIDVTGETSPWTEFKSLSNRDLVATYAELTKYLTAANPTKSIIPFTLWVVGDMLLPSGRRLLESAAEYAKNSRLIRISVVHNTKTTLSTTEMQYIRLIDGAISRNDLKLIQKLVKEDNALSVISGSRNSNHFGDGLEGDIPLDLHRELASRVLGFFPGQLGVVANGRIVGPLEKDEEFIQEDVALLERHTMSLAGEKIVQLLQDLPGMDNSDLAMKIVALLLSNPSTKTRHNIDDRNSELSVLHFPPRHNDRPFIDITAVVDPLSTGAQKLAPLLLVLQEVLNCRIRIFLNCVEKHSEMPLKSFYRLVLEPDLLFSTDERLLPGPIAKFGVLPLSALLTQNLLVPDNWLVESVWSPYDLDNIRLEDVETDVHSEHELEYLLLEGHCFDQLSGSPPRGLQLTLGTPINPVQVDTIVMANLGYLQLKANPGSWILRLREGRSADIYDIVSHDGTDSPINSTDIQVLISSFKAHVLKLKVAKKSGKQNMDLLAEDDESSGLWNSITSTFSSKTPDEEDNKLNIFSLASGHLYERFIRIMMVSVLKHTKTPVKFWFLKNYLSPTLKDFLPHMAKEYGFEYELVQYKWPRWLHQQKEKQRIIWGYKILFLDVLFPLNIKKIIFVDADQVVRADLKDLRDLDLGGAPYGYTPFCESRKEIDGFRFWKSGYWRNHLQGRKYHISALYVVDLKRFRRIAAGDRLRGQYQALSQDPNSLSNLDQDLPNNMIHQVPIKSLPQEWLWCETWCDDASKKQAKTIDLCNNPMTKEAKLDAAVRIISEWTDYDTEIKNLQERIASNRTIHSIRHDPAEF